MLNIIKNIKINKSNLKLLWLSGAMVILDQISKWAIMELVLRRGDALNIIKWFTLRSDILENYREEFAFVNLMPSFNLVMVWNRGISFGMLSSTNMAVGFAIISLIISMIVMFWMLVISDKILAFSLALIAGGAIGNIIDRLRFGAVFDFIDLYIGEYHWPAFNVADSCIVIGACIMLFITLKNDEVFKK